MTQEGKELLITDLCSRIFYNVKVELDPLIRSTRYTDDIVRTLGSISPQHGTVRCLNPTNPEWFGKTYNVKYIKPYLRPMTSMSAKEKQDFALFGFHVIDHDNANRNICPSLVVIETKDVLHICEMTDWLNAHHFDFRGLIENGLAIEAPEGMYNI